MIPWEWLVPAYLAGLASLPAVMAIVIMLQRRIVYRSRMRP